MRRAAIALGLVLPSLDLVSDAFVFRAPALRTATSVSCREHAAVVAAAGATSLTSQLEEEAHRGSSCRRGWRAADFVRQRHRRQVWWVLLLCVCVRVVVLWGRVHCMRSFRRPQSHIFVAVYTMYRRTWWLPYIVTATVQPLHVQ